MTGKSRKQRIEEMLASDPENAEMRYLLAMECVTEGDDKAALDHFEEVIRLDPSYPHSYHQAGRALARLGNIGQAREILQRGIPVAQQAGNFHAAGEMTEFLQGLG